MTTDSESSISKVAAIQRAEHRIGLVLRLGVLISTALIVGGLLTSTIRHVDEWLNAQSLPALIGPKAEFPTSLAGLASELGEFRGRALVTLGLLLLIVTPVVRVAMSIVTFATQWDWRFVVLTSAVLITLLTSFIVGKVE